MKVATNLLTLLLLATAGLAQDTRPPEPPSQPSADIHSAANRILVTWASNTEPDLAGYRLYVGTNPRNYGLMLDLAKAVSYTMQDEKDSLNLDPGVPYHIAITAYDTSGNESSFSDEIVATLPQPQLDQTAPIISAIAVREVTRNAVTLFWTTSEFATSGVNWGLNTPNIQTESRLPLTILHSIRLTNLQPSTRYRYQLKSRDLAGNLRMSAIYIFATAK